MAYIRVGIHQKAYRDLHVIIDGEFFALEDRYLITQSEKITKKQKSTLDKLGGGDFEILIAEEGGVQINLK